MRGRLKNRFGVRINLGLEEENVTHDAPLGTLKTEWSCSAIAEIDASARDRYPSDLPNRETKIIWCAAQHIGNFWASPR